MRTVPRICCLLLTVGVCVLNANAQVDAAVVVSRTGKQINVTVNRPNPLGTVLNQVCQESNAQCEGTEQANGVMVPAQRISGDWSHVISSLLDGTDLNYASREPDASSGGGLNIIGVSSRAASESRTDRAGENATRAESTNDPAQPSVADATSASVSMNVPQESSAEAVSRPDAVSTGAAAFPNGNETSFTSASAPAQGISTGAAGQGSPGAKPDRMLFADTFGNPIPIPQQSPEYLLFPDGRGNLIPVPSQPSSSPYMLFPDSNGKPVPVSTQAPQYLLFPDGNGRLIPVQQGTP